MLDEIRKGIRLHTRQHAIRLLLLSFFFFLRFYSASLILDTHFYGLDPHLFSILSSLSFPLVF